jgi:hypothetical protein
MVLIEKQKQTLDAGNTESVFTFDELSPDAQEEALEYQRVMASEEDFWKEDYMLFEGREMNGVEAGKAFKGFTKAYYDMDSGDYIQFPDLEVKDDAKFYEFAGLSDEIRAKVEVRFGEPEKYGGDYDTEVNFFQTSGDDLTENYDSSDYDSYRSDVDEYYDERPRGGEIKYANPPITQAEFGALYDAKDRVDDFLSNTLTKYSEAYEYSMSDEALKYTIDANEYQFDDDGTINDDETLILHGDYSKSKVKMEEAQRQMAEHRLRRQKETYKKAVDAKPMIRSKLF